MENGVSGPVFESPHDEPKTTASTSATDRHTLALPSALT